MLKLKISCFNFYSKKEQHIEFLNFFIVEKNSWQSHLTGAAPSTILI